MKRVVILTLVILFAAGVATGQDLRSIKKKIRAAAGAGDWASISSAIRELGSINSLESAKTIIKYAFILDQFPTVPDSARADAFDAARAALKQITDEQALAFMHKEMLKNKIWEVRCLLAEVLGERGGEDNRRALCKLIRKDRQPEVLREALKWIVKAGGYDSVDALIDLLEKMETEKGLAWVDTRRALTTLASKDYKTAREWRQYWIIRKDELKADPGSPDTAAPAAPGSVKTGLDEEIKKAPKFFGKEILSKRFCFIIDVSGSMAERDTYSAGGEGGGKPVEAMRIKMVKDQLIKLIAALDPKTRFNIIAYSIGVVSWQKKRLFPATARYKKAAIEFVKKFTPIGTTHTDGALKEAFANKEADTIVLLTDGAPTHDGSYKDSASIISNIFSFVRNANRSRKATILTFGFDSVTSKHTAKEQGQAFLDFLKRLASENNGKFTNIR